MPEGECINIRQSTSPCDICYTSGTLLKENVRLAYIVIDADYDSGKLV